MGGWGWGWVWGCGGVSHAYTHAHTCMHMHVKHANHAKHGFLHARRPFAISIHVCICVCMHACLCAYVGGHPPCPQMPLTPPHPPASSPELQGAQNTKISISPELIEIIRFCLKILYL